MKPKQPRAPTTFDDQGYASHKGHFHDKSGKKFSQRPQGEGDDHIQDKPPSEAQVQKEVVDVERKKSKRGRKQLSTANTVLSNAGLG